MVRLARRMWIANPATAPKVYVAMISSADGVLLTGGQRGNASMTESEDPVILLMGFARFRKSMAPEFGWPIE